MSALNDRVALVTGASRGVGKGIALALGSAGATVYITGRSYDQAAGPLPGSLAETAAEIASRGGRAIPLRCDHSVDADVEAVFERITADSGGLDILVNNVYCVPDGPMFDTPFWQQPLSMWDEMHRVGLRSHYVASRLAVPHMVAQKRGLIAHISSFGGRSYQLNVAYGVGKAAVDRMARDMGHELRDHGVACVSLWPGIVRTERILAFADQLPFDLSNSESPEFTGRAIIALATDPALMQRSGRVWIVAELAREYEFTDIDGSQPPPLMASSRGGEKR